MQSLVAVALRLLELTVRLVVTFFALVNTTTRARSDRAPDARPRLLVIFPDEWLAYSPTVLNLVESLSSDFEITVVAVETTRFRPATGLPARVVSVGFGRRSEAMLRALHLTGVARAFRLACTVAGLAGLQGFDRVIGVDSVGVWVGMHCHHAQVHHLSLEVAHDEFFTALDPNRLASVTIQTTERLHYLFPDGVACPVVFLPNAPRIEYAPEVTGLGFTPHVVLLGNAVPSHGVYSCIEALRQPQAAGIQLTIKGNIPSDIRASVEVRHADLLGAGRLVLDDGYLPQQDLLHYLARFSAGLVIYELDMIAAEDFNYLSCPSGKLFNYYAAGVPVIGSDILGLASVTEFETGVLLSSPTPAAIADALQQIRDDHGRFTENCRRAARHFDFAAAVHPLRDLLVTDSDPAPA